MVTQTWADVTVSAFQALWQNFIAYLPNILGAVIVFIVGWIIAVGLEKLAIQIVKFLRLDPFLAKMGIGKSIEKAGYKVNVGHWFGFFVKWFLVFVFLIAATDILGWVEVTDFLKSILLYVPNVLIAVVILLVAVWAADVMQKIICACVSAANIKAVNLSAAITKWAILIFGILAALIQLGISPGLIQTLITGLVAMLAIAGGLSFGLGGKDAAGSFLNKLRKEFFE